MAIFLWFCFLMINVQMHIWLVHQWLDTSDKTRRSDLIRRYSFVLRLLSHDESLWILMRKQLSKENKQSVSTVLLNNTFVKHAYPPEMFNLPYTWVKQIKQIVFDGEKNVEKDQTKQTNISFLTKNI